MKIEELEPALKNTNMIVESGYWLLRFFRQAPTRVYYLTDEERDALYRRDRIRGWDAHWMGAVIRHSNRRVTGIDFYQGYHQGCPKPCSFVTPEMLRDTVKVIDLIESMRRDNGRGKQTTGRRPED